METKRKPNISGNESEHHHHKILYTVIGVLLLLLVLGAAALWQTQKVIAPITQQQQTNPTADWKTYSNAEYGFEFKYPATGAVESQEHSADTDFGIFVWPNVERADGTGLALRIYLSSRTDREGTPTTFAGHSALISNQKSDIGLDFKRIIVADYKENADLVIDVGPIAVFDQILSTFKFTEADVSIIPGWTVCKNTEQGYEFQYPKEWRFWSDGMYSTVTKEQKCVGSNIVLSAGSGPENDNPTLRVSVSSVTCNDSPCVSVVQYFAGPNTAEFQAKWSEAFVVKTMKQSGQDFYWLKDRQGVYVMNKGKLIEIRDTNIDSSDFNQILSTFKFTK